MSPTIVYILGGFLVGIFTGNFKPMAWIHKAPPTKEVIKLQADLTDAQKSAEVANKAKEAAEATERAKLEGQIRAAQVDAAGVNAALARAAKSPETALASRMAQRVSLKLATAIGKLPEDQQQAMVELIEQALSDKQAEVDAANVKLAKADADFKLITAQRDQVAAQIPILAEQAVKAQEKAQSVQDKLTVKTNEVVTWAAAKDEADKRAGSFFGAWATMKHWAWGIGGVAVILAGIALYLRMGLGSVGAGIHSLQKVMPPEDYQKVVSTLDGETDRLHQWLIRTGKNTAATVAAKAALL